MASLTQEKHNSRMEAQGKLIQEQQWQIREQSKQIRELLPLLV